MASYDEVIPPGEVGTLSATLKTDKLRGKVLKTIRVETNDPNLGRFQLSIRAEIVGSVRILPDKRFFLTNNGTNRRSITRIVRREEIETGELEVTLAGAPPEGVTIEARKVEEKIEKVAGLRIDAQPGDWLIEANLTEDEPYGSFRHDIVILTGLSREPKVSLPLAVRRSQAVTAHGTSVELLPDESGAAQGEVTVQLRRGLNPARLRAEVEPAADYSVELTRKGESLQFTARVRANEAAGSDGGRLRFFVDDETTELPVRRHASP